MKLSHQILLAESMYDPNQSCPLASCLECQFPQCLADEHFLANFVQFMENAGATSKILIRCFLQANCLRCSIDENFPQVKLHVLGDESKVLDIEPDKVEVYQQFVEDFQHLYHQAAPSSTIQIDNNLRDELECLFETNDRVDGNMSKHLEVDVLCLRLFNQFWQCLSHQIEAMFVGPFLKSNYFLKYELDVVRSRTLTLADILYSNSLIESAFLDFSNTEGIKDYIDFLLVYKNYKVYSGQYADAVAIFERFFTSPPLLAFSEARLLELALAMNEKHFRAECYDALASILVQYFSKTYLPQFFECEQFRDYLADVEAKLSCERQQQQQQQADKCQSVQGKMNSLSSQSSIEQQQGANNLGKGQLQFTYIDRYGRMNSLVEQSLSSSSSCSSPGGPHTLTSPTSSTTTNNSPGGKLSKVIKRFAFSTSTENDEENAWRIAESIVNDVCSVTIPEEHPGGGGNFNRTITK